MSRGRLKDEDEKVIVMNFVWLKEQIEAKDIVDYLFQHGVLTLNDRERILSGTTQSDRMDSLLTIILGAGPNDAFEVFLRSLEKKYRHVEEKLRQSARDDSAHNLRSSKLMEDIKQLNKDRREEKQRLLAEKESLKLKHEREIKQLKEKMADLEISNDNKTKLFSETIEKLKKENEVMKNIFNNTRYTRENKSRRKPTNVTEKLDLDSDTDDFDFYLEEDIESVKREIQKFKSDLN